MPSQLTPTDDRGNRTMHNVDFLPDAYRQKHARRRSQPWQAFVAFAIVALVIVATLAQQYRKHRIQNALADIGPVYEAAVVQQVQLAKTQLRLKEARAGAELYTYLRHPWPRTQLLSALVRPLPPAITLQQIQILREAPASTGTTEIRPGVDKKAEEDRLKLLGPADRDLAKLRGQYDVLRTVVVLTGTATEIDALHPYIGALDALEIFDKADLDSFNSIDHSNSGDVLQFRAVLAVQPGYGQPGGPTRPEGQGRPPATIADSRLRRTTP